MPLPRATLRSLSNSLGKKSSFFSLSILGILFFVAVIFGGSVFAQNSPPQAATSTADVLGAATSTPVTATSTASVVFASNQRIFSLETLNVYRSSDFSHLPTGTQHAGSQGSIADDPVKDADGFTWLKVQYDSGVSGWVVGSYVRPVPIASGLSLQGEERLTDSVALRSHPRVSGNRVVWQESRNGTPAIYLYNLATKKTRRLTSEDATETQPSISGDKVAYLDRRPDENNPGHDLVRVYLYDFSSGKTKPLTDDSTFQSQPIISGDQVAYVEINGGLRTLFVYNLLTDTKDSIATGADISGLGLAGDYVVWTDSVEGKWKAYAYDLKTKVQQTITNHFGDQLNPAVSSDGKVVVADRRPPAMGDQWDIYLYDLVNNTEKKITKASGSQPPEPSISGNLITWSSGGNLDSYDIKADTETKLTNFSAEQKEITLDGTTLVWVDGRNGSDDIYVRP